MWFKFVDMLCSYWLTSEVPRRLRFGQLDLSRTGLVLALVALLMHNEPPAELPGGPIEQASGRSHSHLMPES